MKYLLKNNRDGSPAVYETNVSIRETEKSIIFTFDAKHSRFYCPNNRYNGIHSCGDAVEILIGTDHDRRDYYEIEVNPEGEIMLAKMTYLGEDENGRVKLDIGFIDKADCFVGAVVKKTIDGYLAEITIDKLELDLSVGEVYFNAYRLETDGGEMEKHLFALNPTMCGKFHVPTRYVMLRDYLSPGK